MYDLIIVGGGPAGLAAAVYAARYKLKTVIISKETGGWMMYTHKIENYPGFKSILGSELTENMKEHTKSLGVEIKDEEVVEVEKENNVFKATTKKGVYEGKTIIIALGTQRRKLNVKGEENFLGKGVSYCATCDAPFFKNKTVGVVGGGDSACKSALLISEYASKVYVFARGKELTAEPINVERLKQNKKVEILYNAEVAEINGDNAVKSVVLANKKNITLDGIFIEIGMVPSLALIKQLKLEMDDKGFIKTNTEMETNVEGCYAAGDIISKQLRQIVTACADGAIAAFSAYRFLRLK